MNKKSLVLVSLFITANCITISAQTSKGKFLIGGISYIEQIGSGMTSTNIGYTRGKNKDDSGDEDQHKDKEFSFNFSPILGVDLTFASSFGKTTNAAYKNNATYVGVAIPLGEKASFDTLLGYQSTSYKAKEDNENNHRTLVGTVGLKPGFTIFPGSE